MVIARDYHRRLAGTGSGRAEFSAVAEIEGQHLGNGQLSK